MQLQALEGINIFTIGGKLDLNYTLSFSFEFLLHLESIAAKYEEHIAYRRFLSAGKPRSAEYHNSFILQWIFTVTLANLN